MTLFTSPGRACLQMPAHCCYKMLSTQASIGGEEEGVRTLGADVGSSCRPSIRSTVKHLITYAGWLIDLVINALAVACNIFRFATDHDRNPSSVGT